MEEVKQYLFDKMCEVMEKKQEAHVQYLLAERECAIVQAAYRAFIDAMQEDGNND